VLDGPVFGVGDFGEPITRVPLDLRCCSLAAVDLKNFLFRLLSRFGVVVARRSRVWELHATAHLQNLLTRLRIDCVLDVGANIGQYRDFMRGRIGYKGLIVSFEPIPEVASVLKKRAMSDPLWVIEECALGASAGTMPLNVMAGTQFSSFLGPDHSEVTLFKEQNRVARQVTVTVRTLDEVFAEIETTYQRTSVYLKLDTQGYDLEVVKGSTRTLGYVRAMQTEASVKPIYQGGPDFCRSIRTLQGLGYELSGIFPNNAGHFPTLIEFDAVLIHSSQIEHARTP